MRIIVAHTEKVVAELSVAADKRAAAIRPRKAIRLDRHIRQAEWAERLQGRF